LSRGE
jgi:hypothetical protein